MDIENRRKARSIIDSLDPAVAQEIYRELDTRRRTAANNKADTDDTGFPREQLYREYVAYVTECSHIPTIPVSFITWLEQA